MSNEEQAVLDFFAQQENLPLALSVADLVDGIRRRMNNEFWRALHAQLATLIESRGLPWTVQLTEDRNEEDCLVGLHLQPRVEQAVFLRLMMEQQYMGDAPRIYYGMMWSAAPGPDKAGRPEVQALHELLRGDGFKSNESFLAWNWTPYHPRRKDFLQRYADAGNALLDEAGGLLRHFLLIRGDALNAANAALGDAPRAVTVSLDELRASLKKPAL